MLIGAIEAWTLRGRKLLRRSMVYTMLSVLAMLLLLGEVLLGLLEWLRRTLLEGNWGNSLG